MPAQRVSAPQKRTINMSSTFAGMDEALANVEELVETYTQANVRNHLRRRNIGSNR